MTQSLLEKARESARLARERAHLRMIGGDSTEILETPPEIRKAIDEAIKRARSKQTGDLDSLDQEGGAKNLSLVRSKAELRKKAMESSQKDTVPSVKAVMNSIRSHVAYVNGHLLGEKISQKTGKKVTTRYFHGTPAAAAAKVVSMINKSITREGVTTPAEYPSVGVENAVEIKMKEVTKGVHDIKGQPYVREYYGWREHLTGKVINKGGAEIRVNWVSKVVPKRGSKTAQSAHELSLKVGQRKQGDLRKAQAAKTQKGQVNRHTVASVMKEAGVAKKLLQLKEAQKKK